MTLEKTGSWKSTKLCESSIAPVARKGPSSLQPRHFSMSLLFVKWSVLWGTCTEVIFWLLNAVKGTGRSYSGKFLILWVLLNLWFETELLFYFLLMLLLLLLRIHTFSYDPSLYIYSSYVMMKRALWFRQIRTEFEGFRGLLQHIIILIYAYFPLPNSIDWHFTTGNTKMLKRFWKAYLCYRLFILNLKTDEVIQADDWIY